ncbi:hypothetical protein AKJ16_DCAP21883 [Drosera capensis]
MAVAFDLQSFILRARVLKLYRQALRICRRAPSHARDELRRTVRQEMEKNREFSDKHRIRSALMSTALPIIPPVSAYLEEWNMISDGCFGCELEAVIRQLLFMNRRESNNGPVSHKNPVPEIWSSPVGKSAVLNVSEEDATGCDS